MKAFASIGTAVLFVSLATIVSAFALQDQKQTKGEQKQPQQHAQSQEQQKHQQPQKAQSQNQGKQQHEQQAQQPKNDNQQHQQQAQHQSQNNQKHQQQAQQHNQKKQENQQQALKHSNNHEREYHSPEQQHAQQAAWQEHRSQNWHSDHRNWEQRGGYNGYRIPDDHYHGYFGPSHTFVIYNQPYMVVGGYPRFQHGGYWFSVVDPWPNSWANNWYQTDDVYVVYANNGYYMYSRRHPSVGIAISVSL